MQIMYDAVGLNAHSNCTYTESLTNLWFAISSRKSCRCNTRRHHLTAGEKN